MTILILLAIAVALALGLALILNARRDRMPDGEKIDCPRCGSHNPAHASFCGQCGAGLRS